MSEPNPDYVHEKVQGIDVVTFFDRIPCCSSDRVKDRLCDLVDGGVERLILDLSNVECVNETFVATLIAVRRRLSGEEPLRRGAVFRICDDRQSALDVISSSTSDPLILCSVGTQPRVAFRMLQLWNGPD